MAKKAKPRIMLNNEWRKLFDSLTNEKAGELIKAAFAHHDGEDVQMDDPVLKAVFQMIAGVMDKDDAEYQDKCEKNRINRNGGERPSTTVNDRQRPSTTATNKIKENKIKDKEKLSSNEDSKKKPAPKEKPMHFGELGNVLLTETEHAKLIADYGQQAVDDAIKFLDEYIADKGYKHKSPTHNLAMRRWVFDALNKRKAPPGKIRPIKNGYSERTYDYDAIEKELFDQMLAE